LWDRTAVQLLDWYVNEFWGALTPRAQTPLVVVFLKVIYETVKPAFRLVRWRSPRAGDRQAIMATLEGALGAPGTRCAVHIVNELTAITEDDVKDWFSKHGIYDSERKRQELAASLFRRRPTRPMVDVEVALEEIHNDFVRQHSRERGEVTW
jgi:hypothetical protein